MPLAGLHAQQVSTSAPRRPGPPTARPTKLQLPKATVAGLPVIAVVHRLSGWQLRALLPHSAAPFATTFDDSFIRTNIVAGYVLPDGRSVVARLPRDEAEMLDFAAQFRTDGLQASTEQPTLTFVRNDGSELKARFVGLDASTGLSLLEAEQPLAPPAQEGAPAAPPAIGQHVRVIAPLPAVAADTTPAAPAATQATTVAPPDTAPAGETGMIYMSMSEAAGQLTQIKRSPTGKPVEFTIEVEQSSPDWGGGVAFATTGELVGIVNESAARATRLVSAESVRAAAARVLARRASVPQPWLGARGDAVALTPLNLFVARGWPELEARAMVNRHQGVLLTDVAPGTPAAVAGLRSGDIVARISQHEVRSVEDMSLLLQELGSNSVARFTVLRAAGPPLDLSVRLSEAQNPALETAQAEARAAEAEIKLAESEARLAAAETRLAEIETRTAQVEVRTCEAELRVAATDALKATAQKRLREAQEHMLSLQTRMAQAQERAKAAQLHTVDAQLRLHAAEVRMKRASDEHFGMPVMWLLPYGVRAVSLWPPGAAPVSGRAGLLVVSIKPESRAAQAGLRLGDIIETINGRRAHELGDLTEESPAEADFVNLLGIQRDGQSLTLKLTRPPEK
ncbi:MAG: PDZ domain-containing protein [Pyrinomonadaceae bacterium]